ncbi:MAG: 30S ribosomal protein S12 methylthiotransferase RimO [Lachnospiraceae bacterium]|nr:30S ribosomal protein S12 methylthiotransferase RimO [Lachnospiraceae bacterium]
MKILFVSLGCDKNSVDSEVMLGVLSDAGFELTDDEEEAEAAVVNTCCFINDAKEESIDTIIALGKRRTSGQFRALIVAGCLAERYFDEIRKELPEVDAVVNTASIEKIAEALKSVLEGAPRDFRAPLDSPLPEYDKRILATGACYDSGYYGFLKIAEGCDRRCTYCVIPSVRGPYRSFPMETLLAEAKSLAEKGVKELNLVAQETTLYGTDLYGKKTLPELLRRLCGIEGIEWIRLLYCYPEEITEELIDTIASEEKVLPYLDLPVQSGSDRILALMGRRTNREEITSLAARLREKIPGICLRTTLITGFPSETEEDHRETLRMMEEIRFDRLGVFVYSEEEGTAAAAMKDKVKESVALKRWNEIMALQQEIAFELASEKEGLILPVLTEGLLPGEGVYAGRSYMDAPGVDGYVFYPSDRELMSGEIVKVRILEAKDYDLVGELI